MRAAPQLRRIWLSAALLTAGLPALWPLAVPASAGWEKPGGHLKLQLSRRLFGADDLGAALVGEEVDDLTLDLRLDALYRHRRWDVTVESQLLGLAGDSPVALAGGRAGDPRTEELFGLLAPTEDRQWWDLAHAISQDDQRLLLARLDRLSVGYTGDRLVLRLGRQALSWGNGLVFQVLDLFNPFPPNVIDTDYKPGSDMLSAQWLLAGGGDVQAIAVPRRSGAGEPVTAGESSLAVKWHRFRGAGEMDLLLARHVGDTVVGLGLTGNLGAGVWRLDLAHAFVDGGGGAFSLVANLDRSWLWGERNVYGYLELFRNGFGEPSLGGPLEALDPELLERLDRGELFNLGRHELAAGLRLEWTPRLTFEPVVLLALDDASALAQLKLRFDWLQDLLIDAGLQTAIGPGGSEYGGVPTPSGPLLGPGQRLWVRVSRYY